MKSTPVRCSRARMLRPSRPMMRPFMSSACSWTTDTVVSAAWPAAMRCMTTERMLRTRRSASRLVSSSIARTRRAESCRTWSSSSLSSSALACEADSPDARSSARTAFSRVSSICRSRSPSLRSRSASSVSRFSSDSSRRASRCSASPSTSGFGDFCVVTAGARRRPRRRLGRSQSPTPGERFASTPAAITRPAARPRATTTAAITISIAFPLPGAVARGRRRELSHCLWKRGRPIRARHERERA